MLAYRREQQASEERTKEKETPETKAETPRRQAKATGIERSLKTKLHQQQQRQQTANAPRHDAPVLVQNNMRAVVHVKHEKSRLQELQRLEEVRKDPPDQRRDQNSLYGSLRTFYVTA